MDFTSQRLWEVLFSDIDCRRVSSCWTVDRHLELAYGVHTRTITFQLRLAFLSVRWVTTIRAGTVYSCIIREVDSQMMPHAVSA